MKIGNPVLRESCKAVSLSDISSAGTQALIDDLIETRRAVNGAGLAAPQIGVAVRIFVAENDNNPRYPYKPSIPLTVVVNPKITFLTNDQYESNEGCLSIPDVRGVVERCPEIRVEGFDRDGKVLNILVRGVSAGTFQHEDDHLNGILFPDRVKDTRSLSTWDEFRQRHETAFARQVAALVERYGS